MKKFLLAGVAAAAFVSAPALAADYPVKAAPMDPGFSWTGCYIGVNGGGGWGRDQWYDLGGGVSTPEAKPHLSGGVAGGQLGCDYQVGTWVVGVQGMYDWANIKGSTFDPLNTAIIEGTKIKSIASATGRLGYAWGRGLLYVKGGWAESSTSYTLTGLSANGLNPTGWTAGVGSEIVFANQNNWSLIVEWNHYDFGNKINTNFVPAAIPFNHRLQADTITAGLNYRFGWMR
jgi:outer membrane immunogenic protein